ncbi:ABC transporter substrate-binding protein [uncultured Ilyobacter sp.]|uniref:ABC transporter substrate-binding protein n=1 Tax=uncultured Ilyobacter sp. TaxID=544433 RepID=UPI0029C00209|nr:ABC transporter substrate-binding protein [uncultured Ilyobacter sp.]
MIKRIAILFAMVAAMAFGSEKKITAVLDWTPNTNHTGLYVAKEMGYFKDEGLDVTIIQPANGTSDQLVASGRADFGISYQESVTFARLEGVPIVSLGAIIQHNTSGFASVEEKKIETPKDFEGKNYGGWGSPVETATLKELMKKDGGDFSKVNVLTTGDMDFFKASKNHVDFAWVFEGWTNIEAKLKGYDINYIPLNEYSDALDYYTPIITTSERKIIKERKDVEKFMRAVKKGYEYAIKNPMSAAEILTRAVPELDEKLVKESQKFLAGKYQDDAQYWGKQKESVWINYQEWLYENNLIKRKTDMGKAFTNEFLED